MVDGSVYILKNPCFREENMLKIGRTTLTVKQRAKKLSTTGLPDDFDVVYEEDVPDCVLAEKLIHEKLRKYRYRNEREFFVLPLQEAISAVQQVVQEQFHKIFLIHEGTYAFSAGTTFRWNCRCKGLMFLARHQNWFDDQPSIEGLWWCKPRDHVIFTNRIEDNPEELIEFAADSKIDGSLSEITNLYPGDRLAIIEPANSEVGFRQMSLFTEDSLAISIIDFWEYGRMVAFMEDAEIHPEGFPIPFGAAEHTEVSPADTRKVFEKILGMGTPRVCPDANYAQSLKSGFDY
jgi:T5orf172 domain